MNLIKCIMSQSTCYRGTSKGVPVGVLWHDTGAGNPEIKRYVQPDDDASNRAELLKIIGKNANGNDWNHRYVEAGVNAFIGKLADGSIATVQTLPFNYRPWGCGSGSHGSCNGSSALYNSPFWIQFEICDDYYKDAAYFKKVYKEAVEFTAYICKTYGIDPNGTVKYNGVTVPTILCHADSYKLGLGSAHGDVLDWFKKMGGYTMDKVRKDVAELLKPPEEPGEEEMTKEQVAEIAKSVAEKIVAEKVDKAIEKAIGKQINTIDDIPWESVRKEMRELLDLEAIDGGTDYDVNPDDIKLPLEIVRAIVVAKRYVISVLKGALNSE